MINLLIKTASLLVEIGVLVFTGIGSIIGGNIAGGADRTVGYIIGAILGFLVSVVIFGVAAAIFDMQKSLRVLANAERRKARLEASLASGSGRKDAAA